MRRCVALVTVAASLVALNGCGSGAETEPQAQHQRASAVPGDPPRKNLASLPRASCPGGAGNCRSAEGTIVYIERVDPDGDGDAHFVLASADSVTGPGISVIDVERALRPHPLPGLGWLVSAAGPVYRGSYGQRQIQATELHVSPR
jgi:hypothetical protein